MWWNSIACSDLARDIAGAIETEARAHIDPDSGIDVQPGAAQDGEQFLARADPGAAIAEIAGGALEDGRVPADGAEQVRGDQPADRAADHQGARHHSALMPSAISLGGACDASSLAL
jgi:hypothetical protein